MLKLILFIPLYIYESVCPFLYYTASPQSVSLGYTVVANDKDPMGVLFNPALAGVRPVESSHMNTPLPSSIRETLMRPFLGVVPMLPQWYVEDLRLTAYTYNLPLKRFGLSLNFAREYFWGYRGTLYYPDTSIPYRAYEYSYNFTVAGKLPYNLRAGVTLKYIYSFIGYTDPFFIGDTTPTKLEGKAVAFDFGIFYKTPIGFSLGASILNLGQKISYTEHVENDLPRHYRIGIGFSSSELFKALGKKKTGNFVETRLFFELVRDLVGEQHRTFNYYGYEFSILKSAFIRYGYGKEGPSLKRRTVGAGLKIGAVSLDWANDMDMRGNYFVSLTVGERGEGFLESVVPAPYIGLLDAILIPGGGQIYRGDGRGLLYLATGFLTWNNSKEGDKELFTALYIMTHLLSLSDYVLTEFILKKGGLQ